ncbi:sulfotransferase 1C2-like [Littorina saxatilis]|uniref:sulfotransferase 1C2-like n=1 Tax=Littorina saxatilis TaxID=31220 RepID=UPI0038B57052
MPALPAQVVRSQSFTFHDSDVILLGYAKSGSHWLWEMVHMLMKGRPEYCTTPKERLMLSFSTQEFFDTLDPPRVFNCHAPWQGLPPALRTCQSECRMIYILRNPQDVAVSYYHQLSKQKIFDYEGSFHGYLDLFLEGKVPGGSWFDYVLGWEETMKNSPHLPLLVLYYEDTKEDTVATLRKVNQFLGLGRSEELLREVADCCTISKMRHMDQNLEHHLKDNPNVSKTGQSFIYRKGQVGDWKNYFSVPDNNRFERMIKTKLKNSSLVFRYELEGENAEDL